MKTLFTYILLGAFILLIVPRELVHHHDHDLNVSTEIPTDDHGVSIDQEHCFACEFTFDETPTPLSFQFKLYEVTYQNFIETKYNLYASSEFDSFALRGPPII